MYSFDTIIFISFVAPWPLSSLDPLCETYNAIGNPTCVTTFKNSTPAVRRLVQFKHEVEATCGPVRCTPMKFNISSRTIGTTLPNEVFDQLIASEKNSDYIFRYTCVL
ncbi:hypothetical protein DSO57_1023161 [Entomophthora muscae]|uniref:Uncharacterized protein n=1 Tax=Entomophthora muscae TaxID=34485 RepID=A0ACC2TQ20_9FUNG|nr:hypothetical protein DSO57_1023161 [Entomophthora muscae]